MKTKRPRTVKPKLKTIIMTGGVNQSVSNLELQPGELFESLNYEEIDGAHYGYRCTDGYERVDGDTIPSDTSLSFNFTVTPPTVDEDARETARATVVEVPGTGNTFGTFKLDDDWWVFKSITPGGTLRLYKKAAGAWYELPSFTALAIPEPTLNPHVAVQRFAGAFGNANVAVICTNTSRPIIIKDDGIAYFIEDGSDAAGHAAGTLPNLGVGIFAYRSIKFNNRLFLMYPSGQLVFGGLADNVLIFDPVTLGGIYYLEDTITDALSGPNTLAVFCEDSIHLVAKTDYNIATGIDMSKEIFNDQEGAYANTVQKVMGRIFYASKEGITTLDTTASFGDFEQFAISKNVQKTFDALKNTIIASSVIRDKSQYRLYFSDGTIITVTLNIEKEVKGATILFYPIAMDSIWEDNDNIAYMTSQGQDWLYRRSSDACSFDYTQITATIKTAYYNYSLPSNWKYFSRLLTEVDAPSGTHLTIRPIFDYANSQSARVQDEWLITAGGIWSGSFTWGTTGASTETIWAAPSGAVQQVYSHIHGVGVNMSIVYSSVQRHYTPHTIHNCIVTYLPGAMRI